jgi:ribonuclease P protein component
MSSSGAKPKDAIVWRSDRASPVERLTASAQYRLVYREGNRISDELLTVYVRPSGRPGRRIGIAVGGRVHSAVRRNRIRRRLRAAVRAALDAAPAGCDLVVVARAAADRAPFAALQDSVRTLFNRAGGAP